MPRNRVGGLPSRRFESSRFRQVGKGDIMGLLWIAGRKLRRITKTVG